MDKIFHARIHFSMYLFLVLLTAGTYLSFWHHMGVCAAITLVLLVVVVERIIHTTYTLTGDGRLIVSYGRFSRPRVIPLESLRRIERCRRMRIAGKSLYSYLLLVYGEEKHVAVMPVKEEEFIAEVTRRRKAQ